MQNVRVRYKQADGYIDLVIRLKDDASVWIPGNDVANLSVTCMAELQSMNENRLHRRRLNVTNAKSRWRWFQP